MHPTLLAVALLTFSAWVTAAPTPVGGVAGLSDYGVVPVADLSGYVKREGDSLTGPTKRQEEDWPPSGRRSKREGGTLPGPAKRQEELPPPPSGSSKRGGTLSGPAKRDDEDGPPIGRRSKREEGSGTGKRQD